MDETIARALEGIVGPLMAEGMELGIAERIAKVRAFDAGTFPGESCMRCSERVALLDPWRKVGQDEVTLLCSHCGGSEAVARDSEARAVRLQPRAFGSCQDCGGHGHTFGGRCWACAHRNLRGESPGRPRAQYTLEIPSMIGSE